LTRTREGVKILSMIEKISKAEHINNKAAAQKAKSAGGEAVVSRQSRKRNATHVKIMHCAKKLFEEKGLGNVTIEEITEAADVSRSTFFSHFASLEALSTEIAGVAIEEILDAAKCGGKSGKEGVCALLYKLVDDTCPYPYLSAELLMNGIIKSRKHSPFYYFEAFVEKELQNQGVSEDAFSIKEQSALILGAFFGICFQKFLNGEKFDKPDEIKATIKKFIDNFMGGAK
jgi:AcrR family transcriptional regulator